MLVKEPAKTLKQSMILTPEDHAEYEETRLIVDMTDLICKRLKENGVRKSELAKKLGLTKPYVTQMLDGTRNMTLRTVARVFALLGYRLRVEEVPLVVAVPIVQEIYPRSELNPPLRMVA